MTNNTIDESRLYDDLAEYHLKMHYTYTQLAELHKQNIPHEVVPFHNNPTFFYQRLVRTGSDSEHHRYAELSPSADAQF